jgi:hypothetical protein
LLTPVARWSRPARFASQDELDAHGVDVNMGRLSVGDLHTHRRSTAPTATPAQKQLSTFPPSAAVKWRLLIGGEGVVLDEEEHRFSLEITGTKQPKVRNHCRHCSSCCNLPY